MSLVLLLLATMNLLIIVIAVATDSHGWIRKYVLLRNLLMKLGNYQKVNGLSSNGLFLI